MLLWLFACVTPPAEDRPPLAPAPICAEVPDDVAAGMAPWSPARVVDLADVLASGGPNSRCPAILGDDGWVAVLGTRDGSPEVVIARRWPGGPVEVAASRPVPVDLERRIAGFPSWIQPNSPLRTDAMIGPAVEIHWCGPTGCDCSELVWGLDAGGHTEWTCPGRPGPPKALPVVPWPNPEDREGQ